MLLRQADKLVKEGNYEAALEVIAQARVLDPKNAYAEAFEERVRALLGAQKENSANDKNNSTPIPSKSVPLSPVLEQISSLAIQEEERHLHEMAENRVHDSDEQEAKDQLRLNNDVRRAAIIAKIGSYLARAKELATRNEFSRALDEVSRAYLLDAANQEIAQVEKDIRVHQEESLKRKEQVDAEQAHALEERRAEELRTELQRVQHEQEAQKKQEEEARRNAQQEKIKQHLDEARKSLAELNLEKSQDELAFIKALDPSNKEVTVLSREIQEALKKQRDEEAQRAKKKAEEEQKRLQALQQAVQKQITQARELATRQDYSAALTIITRAYILDPVSDDLQECENEILAAQEEFIRQTEERKRREAEAERKRMEEERNKQKADELENILREKNAVREAEKQAQQKELEEHLSSAKEHLAEDQFEQALAEVAAAFRLNPFDEATRVLEQKIRNAQSEHKQASEDDGDEPQQDTGASVESHRVQAERFRDEGDYQRALDEITKAFALDPLNDLISRLSDEILKEFLAHREAISNGERSARTTVHEHLSRAEEFFHKGSFHDALREVNTGLDIDGTNKELLALHGKVSGELQTKKNGKDSSASENRFVKPSKTSHRDRAQLFYAAGQFDEALAEVALALAMDEDDAAVKDLERRIWEAKNSTPTNGQSNSTSSHTDSDSESIQQCLDDADALAVQGEYAKALDELAKAFLIDPFNEEVTSLESKIRQMESSKQNNIRGK